MRDILALTLVGNEYLADSRLIAKGIGVEHEVFIRTLKKYQAKLERWGILRFQNGEIQGRGQPEKYVMLNRNQAAFAITLSRNTDQVVEFKMDLIDAFDRMEKQLAEAKERLAKIAQLQERVEPLNALDTLERSSLYAIKEIRNLRQLIADKSIKKRVSEEDLEDFLAALERFEDKQRKALARVVQEQEVSLEISRLLGEPGLVQRVVAKLEPAS